MSTAAFHVMLFWSAVVAVNSFQFMYMWSSVEHKFLFF